MNYWQGYMNWPLNPDWKCPICGDNTLEWGLVHAQCRCFQCHTEFRMRDKDGVIVDIPIHMIKEEFLQPAIDAYKNLQIPLDDLTDSQWSQYGAPIEEVPA